MSGIHGALLVNKPKGMTSHDVVYKVRKAFKIKEVGHAGTLDPIAEGVLVLLLGEATKVSRYITAEDKTYKASLDLGYTTDTLDVDGEIIKKHADFDLTEDEILRQAHSQVGELKLKVPMYSAVKVDGKKLYDYARSGENIEAPVRSMQFYKSEVLKLTPSSLQVRLECEKGAYIRAWIDQLGQDLKVGATMTALVRESSGRFQLEQCIELDELMQKAQSLGAENLIKEICLEPCFYPLEDCVQGPFFRLDAFEKRLMENGQIAHTLAKRMVPYVHDCIQSNTEQIIRIFTYQNGKDHLQALVQIPKDRPKPKILRVFKTL